MHADTFLREVAAIAERLNRDKIEQLATELLELRRRGGRLFLLGLGGSAANCSHAAADFRKLCDIKAQAPTDNVAEFSARANDDGFSSVFSGWLMASEAGKDDAVLILSVGGGTDQVSLPLMRAIDHASAMRMKVYGIVGPHGGETARRGDLVINVPEARFDDERVGPTYVEVGGGTRVTPHTEAFQAVIWHLLVSHPLLQRRSTKW